MLSLESFVGERFELGAVDGTFEKLDEALPVAGAILAESDGELLLEVEGVGADGAMWWSIGAGGRAHFASDVDHDCALLLGATLDPKRLDLDAGWTVVVAQRKERMGSSRRLGGAVAGRMDAGY